MRNHLDTIRYLMAATGEGFFVPLALVALLLGLSWVGAIMAWGIGQ